MTKLEIELWQYILEGMRRSVKSERELQRLMDFNRRLELKKEELDG